MERLMTLITWEIVVSVCVGEMAANAFRIGLVRLERSIKERLSQVESEQLDS